MRYTNFLVLGMKILLSGNTFCVKWWICSCDLCKWLSGGFVAHPILAVKHSFLVTYDTLDEFPWLANVLHNCQNFAMVFLRNIEKGEVSTASHFFLYRHSFFLLPLSFQYPVHLPCLVIFADLSVCFPWCSLTHTFRLFLREQLCHSLLRRSNTWVLEFPSCV